MGEPRGWPTSPGWATDLELHLLQGGGLEDDDDHLVVRTPANPTYHWGNCLILRSAPARGSLGDWLATFHDAHPGAEHVAIGIDDPDAALDPDEAAALNLAVEGDVVLTTESVTGGLPPEGYRIATVDPDDEAAWAALVELELADLGPDADAQARESMARFRAGRYAAHRSLVHTGHGRWWAAYAPSGEPVATLGLFCLGEGRARFQDVLTHPDHRQRGLAAALVAAAGREQLAAGSRTLVIVADPDGPAIGVYRRAGFADTARQWRLYRAPD